ncbi:MAG: GGDEF domain-containing protein [Bdellovibrio sp. CG10_big_fil_rev_8_21_14_0_10_47_8]|nr:MAG: GGDEF domain-containing protein [Bdellovibrio sp. CG10_big_fil_rev_8_21_14_0_10_47_8]
MNFSDSKAQFCIFVFFPNADLNTEIKGSLVEEKYDTYIFMDQETLIERVKEAAPHVVIFSPEALLTPMSEFVSQVLSANSEVQFLCVADADQAEALKEYREYNLAGMIAAGEKLKERCVWQVDQVCQTLFRTYQNEDLLKKTEELLQENETLKSQRNEEKAKATVISDSSIGQKIQLYSAATTKDEVLIHFINQLSCQAIYFKYLPTVQSFVATHSHGLDIEAIKGVGTRLEATETAHLLDLLKSGEIPPALAELMKEGLRIGQYFPKPVIVQNSTLTGLDGLFIFWGAEGFHFQQIESDFLIFSLLYQQAHLIKRSEGLDVYDPLTELYNRPHFVHKLEEEIARARRLEKPVSVVCLSLDHMHEIDQSFGRNNRDMILRVIAAIVKKTSRVNDISCRTADSEFSLILPHCGRRGAALRAERLRRIIEAHAFGLGDFKVTISCGVSEYPSLSKGADDLTQSAGQALEFIVGRGGNKVCLYKPMEAFKPDFEVHG